MPDAAIVLAAGGSVRLGRPKQLLTRDGEALVHRALRFASRACASPPVLVTGSGRDAVIAACAGLAHLECFNPHWADGLASSLQCAAGALRTHAGRVLVLGCDQPALEAAHLQRLLAAASRSASGCAATRHGVRAGVPAVLSPALFARVDGLRGDRGFGALLDAQPGVASIDARELTFDLDTPDDMRRAIAAGLLDA